MDFGVGVWVGVGVLNIGVVILGSEYYPDPQSFEAINGGPLMTCLKEIHTATHPARAEVYHTEDRTLPTEHDLFDTLVTEQYADDEETR